MSIEFKNSSTIDNQKTNLMSIYKRFHTDIVNLIKKNCEIMYKVPKQIGWIGQYSEKHDPITGNLDADYEVEWADNDDNLTSEQANCLCDVCSLEEKEVEKIMNDDEFQDYLEKNYKSVTLEIRL